MLYKFKFYTEKEELYYFTRYTNKIKNIIFDINYDDKRRIIIRSYEFWNLNESKHSYQCIDIY